MITGNITYWQWVMMALLLMLPTIMAYVLSPRFVKKIIRSFAILLFAGSMCTICMHLMLTIQSWWPSLLWTVLLASLSGVFVLQRARRRFSLLFLPIMLSIWLVTLFFSIIAVLLIADSHSLLNARYMAPVFAFFTWCATESTSKALATYYTGLNYHGQLYHTLRGNGASHGQALKHFAKRAVEQAFTPILKQMSSRMAPITPFIFFTLCMAEIEPFAAFCIELTLLLGGFSTATIVPLLAGIFSRRFLFDAHGNRTTTNR